MFWPGGRPDYPQAHHAQQQEVCLALLCAYCRLMADPSEFRIGRSDDDVATANERIFGNDQYLKNGWDDEETIEKDAKDFILSSLQRDCRSTETTVAGKALFELAIAHACGFGAEASVELSLQMATKAAKTGYLPALAICSAWHKAHSRDCDEDPAIQLDWLY